ncbi:MAG: DUF488 family protein [Methanosarcinales archaeon]|nr:DUF488 family protein [Methanosarcinales archaeon]
MKLWTIGTSNRSLEEFLGLLEVYQIEAIADVRRFPTSKHKHFKQENLKACLTQASHTITLQNSVVIEKEVIRNI